MHEPSGDNHVDMTHDQLIEVFELAWEEVWTFVLGDFSVLTRREENVRAYLGHFLLRKLCPNLPHSSSGWRISFDVGGAQRVQEHDFIHGDKDWRTRCDAVIRRDKMGSLEGDDQRGILAELKVLRRGIREHGNANEGEPDLRFKNWQEQLSDWQRDVDRLRQLASNDGGKCFKGAMCTLYFCRPPLTKDDVKKLHTDAENCDKWETKRTCAFGRSIKWIDGSPNQESS